MAHNYSNVASIAQVAANVSPSATQMQVVSFTGWPEAPFWALIDRDTAANELVEVTGVSAGVLSIERGKGGTAAATHAAGAAVEHVIPAGLAILAEQHAEATSGVHGVTGAMVGTTNPQTLTSKLFEGGHRHTFSDAQPAGLTAGFEVEADDTSARDGFVVANTGANPDRRAFLLTQSGTPRVQAFMDGTVLVTPSGSATRNAFETTGKVKSGSLEVTGAGSVGGNLTVSGTATSGAVNTGDIDGDSLTISGNAEVGSLTASGAVGAASAAVSGNVSVGGDLSVTGTFEPSAIDSSGNVTGANLVADGTNGYLQLPASTATGSAGRVRYRNGQLEVHNGTNWRGTIGWQYSTASLNAGTFGGTTTLATYTVNDPGWPYDVIVGGSAELFAVSGGARWDLAGRVNGNDVCISEGLVGTSSQPNLTPGIATGLTGNSTVTLVCRRPSGSGNVTVNAAGGFFTVQVVPA